MRIARLATLAACLPVLGGCVVWDIKDSLVSIDEQLTTIDAQLDGINGRLDTLETNLEPLPELHKLEELAAINASIEPIEKHLASLRKTIANIDSTVPFLNISEDTGDEEELQAEPEQTPEEPPVETPAEGDSSE